MFFEEIFVLNAISDVQATMMISYYFKIDFFKSLTYRQVQKLMNINLMLKICLVAIT